MPLKTSPPKPSRRASQKQDKRERIRAAAWSLFTSQGFAKTTTKQVAREAGIASGTLFLYAKDKPDLLFMVYHDRLQKTVDARVASLPEHAGLLDQLLWIFRGVFDSYADQPQLARDFVAALPGATGPNADLMNGTTLKFLGQLADLVRAAQARGEVAPDVVPYQAASNVFALYFGALLQWLSGYVSLNQVLDPVLKRALELQLSGLSPRG